MCRCKMTHNEVIVIEPLVNLKRAWLVQLWSEIWVLQLGDATDSVNPSNFILNYTLYSTTFPMSVTLSIYVYEYP